MALEIVPYRSAMFEGVRALWREAFPDDPPWNAAELAIPAKLAFQPELLLLALEDDDVIGSIMAGYDGHRGWLYALAVLGSHQRQGIGKALIREAEKRLHALGCEKINLQVRVSNAAVVAFYERLGYAVEERLSMGKRLAPKP
jgi:ribosomal protein S18 acetylase RimI-like enzyme